MYISRIHVYEYDVWCMCALRISKASPASQSSKKVGTPSHCQIPFCAIFAKSCLCADWTSKASRVSKSTMYVRFR